MKNRLHRTWILNELVVVGGDEPLEGVPEEHKLEHGVVLRPLDVSVDVDGELGEDKLVKQVVFVVYFSLKFGKFLNAFYGHKTLMRFLNASQNANVNKQIKRMYSSYPTDNLNLSTSSSLRRL